MNVILAHWNSLDPVDSAREILPCCGSRAWAEEMAARRPIVDEATLYLTSDTIWFGLSEGAWQEAFDSHPRIGQQKASGEATAQSLTWSSTEQSTAMSSDEAVKQALAEGNGRYEERFGRIFIVCASGRSAAEILTILETRIENDPETEFREAAEQQRQITQLRLHKWLEAR